MLFFHDGDRDLARLDVQKQSGYPQPFKSSLNSGIQNALGPNCIGKPGTHTHALGVRALPWLLGYIDLIEVRWHGIPNQCRNTAPRGNTAYVCMYVVSAAVISGDQAAMLALGNSI